MAKADNVNREDQDVLSYGSHQTAINAIQNGYFKTGILPVTVEDVYVDDKGKRQTRSYVMDTDEGPRKDTSVEVLWKFFPNQRWRRLCNCDGRKYGEGIRP